MSWRHCADRMLGWRRWRNILSGSRWAKPNTPCGSLPTEKLNRLWRITPRRLPEILIHRRSALITRRL